MSTPLGPSGSAMRSAISGIVEAERMHERAAVAVQRSFHGPDSQTPIRAPDEGSEGLAATLEISEASSDLAGAMTTMIKASAYNKANIAMLKTADQMTRELVNIVG